MIIINVNDKSGCYHVETVEKLCFDDGWTAEMLEIELNNSFSHMLVLYDEKQPVGYICYRELFEVAEILRVAVVPAYRGRGFATMLINEMINQLKIAEEIMLEVDVNNVSALGLYKKIGFEPLNIRKNYYSHPDGSYTDALNMRLILKTEYRIIKN